MNKVAIIALLAFIGAVSLALTVRNMTIERSANDAHINQAFNNWSQYQNKLYNSPAERNYRKAVFSANHEKVTQMNKVNSHKSMLNMFADLTEEEFISKYTGLKVPTEQKRNEATITSLGQSASVDWRTKGAVNPVKDQGQCGSCWAFSATSAIESSLFLKQGKLLNLAEQQMVDCSGSTGNYGCNGGWMDWAFQYIINAGGQELSANYPYLAKDQACAFNPSKVAAKITSFVDIPKNNCGQLVSAIAQQPVSVAIAANAIMFYSSGIFASSNCGTSINHAVIAVGYGTESSQNFYIVRNSWSNAWGEQGYIRMTRDVQTDTGICGICMVTSYPTSA